MTAILRWRKARLAAVAFAAVATQLHAEIVDRIAAIVGTEAITLSEIDTEWRLEAMLNRTPPVRGGRPPDWILERLIDRTLILQGLELVPFLLAQPTEAELQLDLLRQEEFLGGLDFDAALAAYGLTESECLEFLAEQIQFERYIAFRFKTGIETDAGAVEEYYRDEYSRAQSALGMPVEPFEAVAGMIVTLLTERRTNELIEVHLRELRASTRVEMLAGAGREDAP